MDISAIQDELFVLVCLDSIHLEKSLSYHDLWLSWKDLFSFLHVQIYFILPDQQKELDHFCHSYHSPYIYLSDPNFQTLHSLGSYKTKEVFAQSYTVVYPYSFIYHQGTMIKQYRRMNPNQMCDLFLKLLDIRYQDFVSSFKRSIHNIPK